MNFKYGFSQYPRPRIAAPRGARAGLLLHGVVLGLRRVRGAGARAPLMQRDRRRVLSERVTPTQRWGAASAGAGPRADPARSATGSRASRAHETVARDFAHDMLQSVEPYGILITAGDNDTFPLWYAQEVGGHPAGRDAGQPVAHEHRVASAAAPAAGDAGVRSLAKAGPHLAESVPVPHTGPSDAGAHPGAFRSGRSTACRRRCGCRPRAASRSTASRSRSAQDVPAAAGSGDDLSDPRQPGEASDLLQLERRRLSGPDAGAERLPRVPGIRAEADAEAGGGERLDRAEPQRSATSTCHAPARCCGTSTTGRAATRDRPKGWVDPPSGSILTLYQVIYNGAARAFTAAGDSTRALKAEAVSRRVAQELTEGEAFSAGQRAGPSQKD